MGEIAEELLFVLLWTADGLCRPTMRSVGESFESWAHRNGYLDEIHRLEARHFVESRRAATKDTHESNWTLTSAGRLRALGGRDPESQWSRLWDGVWRLVVFDLPERQANLRTKLRRFLKSHGFGRLQRSVWITPDPLPPLADALRHFGCETCRLTLFDATPVSSGSAAMVEASWDFQSINGGYLRYLDQFSGPLGPPGSPGEEEALRHWLQQEQATWFEAVKRDPLLPAALLPENYVGRRAWDHRQGVLREVTSRLVVGTLAGNAGTRLRAGAGGA